MKYALCNETYQGWEFPAICADIAASGYDAVEIAPFTLDDDPWQIDETRARAIASIAHAAGLEVSAFHWLLLKPEGLHLTTADVAVRQRTVAFLQHLARICAAMGGRILVFGSPQQRNVLPGQRYEDAWHYAVAALRSVCEVAHPLGVTLALEPLGPAETNFMQYASETVRLIQAIDHPACRLHLDVKAMCQEHAPVAQIIEQNAAYLAYFHANDANRRGPGFGETEFLPIARMLEHIGYDGYISVEVFDYRPDPKTIARQSIAFLKQTFRQLEAPL